MQLGDWIGREPVAFHRRHTIAPRRTWNDRPVRHIAFRPLRHDDLPTVVEWMGDPAVAEWWNQPADLDSVTDKYGRRIDGADATQMFVVEVDGEPAGMLQCYRHRDHPVHDELVGVPDAVGIDYLLGAAHRGRRLGAHVVRSFADLAFDRHPSTRACVATPAQANVASWRTLERAGFLRRGHCQPPDEPVAFVYVLERTP